MAAEEKSYVEIATILNAENVPTPLKHRQNCNTLHLTINRTVHGMSVWKKENVTRILRDERYTGKIISGKSKKMSYGDVKTKILPKSEWLIVPDCHEPIVSQEVFDKVQAILGPYRVQTQPKKNSHLFANKLFCGHCGYGLRRYSASKKVRPNSNYEPRYACKHSVSMNLERCLPENIRESQITEVILDALRMEFALASTAKERAEMNSKSLMGQHEKIALEAKQLTLEVERLRNSREQLFEEYADGKLTKEQYMTAKTELTENISNAETAIDDISAELTSKVETANLSKNHDILMQYAQVKEVTAEIMHLIKRINVFAGNRFEIEFAFSR